MAKYLLATLPARLTNTSGSPAQYMHTYISGTTTNKTTYTTRDGATPHSNPVEATADGTFPQVWLDSDQLYRIKVVCQDGSTLFTWDNVSGIGFATVEADLADSATVSVGDALVATKRTATGAAATTVHNWIERQPYHTYADFALNPDGSTDHTNSLLTVLTNLSNASYRGFISAPAGTKVNWWTLAQRGNVPNGIRVQVMDTVNWGQPPGYRNSHLYTFLGETVSDDGVDFRASGHHPASGFTNFGTANSTAGRNYYMSMLYSIGKDSVNDPILLMADSVMRKSGTTKWRRALVRLQTPFRVATQAHDGTWASGVAYSAGARVANSAGRVYYTAAGGTSGATEPTHLSGSASDGTVTWQFIQLTRYPSTWVTGTVYGPGAYVLSDSGKVYTTSAGGTSGATAPTGTGTGINDGGVLWDYVQAAMNVDATRCDIDEDGNLGIYGPSTSELTLTLQAGSRSFFLGLDPTTNTVRRRDVSRGRNIDEVSDTGGYRVVTPMSVQFTTVSGATPTASTPGLYVVNGGATNMTGITMDGSMTSGHVICLFGNGNTTLVHSGTFSLKGGVNVTPASGQIVEFIKHPTHSGAWIEKNRSF